MAFSSIGVLADCDCTTTSMRADKMPLLDLGDEVQHAQVQVGSEPFRVGPIKLTGDAVSFVCGNGDGFSFCGSDGSPASTAISFIDASTGAPAAALPPFVAWDGEYFTLHATDISQVGVYSFEMRIGLVSYPAAETRDWPFTIEVIADPNAVDSAEATDIFPFELQQFIQLAPG